MCWLVVLLVLFIKYGESYFFEDLLDLDGSWGISNGNHAGRLDSHDNSSSIINPNNIYEWTPITNKLGAGSRDTFIFSVSAGGSGFGIASTYQVLILLSGNICNQPTDIEGNSLGIYYSFNKTLFSDLSVGKFEEFQNGYLQALAISPLDNHGNNATSRYQNLYVVVTPVDGNAQPLPPPPPEEYKSGKWEYKLSISENDLVYQWDSRSWLEVLDTDHQSALLVTGNVSADAENRQNYSVFNPSLYDLYVYSKEESTRLAKTTNLSLCAVANGDHLASSVRAPAPFVVHPLERTGLAVSKSIANRSGIVREQFYITGLNSSTEYVAYLTKKIGKKGNLSPDGGILFSRQPFRTKSSNNCSLIFGLDFCSDVAYAVPSSSIIDNRTLLAQTFDRYSHSLFQNFSKALQLIPCEMELDARYSPVRTCEDCSKSYRDWLCAITIPRCTLSGQQGYIHRSKEDNRNKFISEKIRPLNGYYEIPPCIEMCYHMVRDCPSDFGFACPDMKNQNDLFRRSYGSFNPKSTVDTCNYIGNTTDLFLTAR